MSSLMARSRAAQHAAVFRGVFPLARRPERQRHQVVDVSDGQPLQSGCREVQVLHRTQILAQQSQPFGFARNAAALEPRAEIENRRRNRLPGNAEHDAAAE